MIDWLGRDLVTATGLCGGTAYRSARVLGELGALTTFRPGQEMIALDRDVGVEIAGAQPNGKGDIAAEYLGLRAAALLLQGGGRLSGTEVSRGLQEGLLPGRSRSTLLRCRDGWLVAHWRNDNELELLEALVDKPLAAASLEEAEAAAADARLLVAAVRPRSGMSHREPNLIAKGVMAEALPIQESKIIDWSSLWAGPWAAGCLAAAGACVTRIEAPFRRDGYLRTPAGRQIWMRWNGMKRLELLDMGVQTDRLRVSQVLRDADLLIGGHAPRVLPQFGFDDEWFAREAPYLSRLSLVAYEDPRQGLPGLGEHAAAAAGLLWNDGKRPLKPRPWADPLLGAWALVIALALSRSGVRGAHVRLSLEAAACRAVAPNYPTIELEEPA